MNIRFDNDKLYINDELISNTIPLKTGMTNQSYIFEYNNKKYIMRIPGLGTDSLINRKNEVAVYSVIKNKNISDNVIYINDKGYKIAEYIEKSRCCDPNSISDLNICMKFLKYFHGLNLKVNHEFNIFDEINSYEKLLKNDSSYVDYFDTKDNVFSLKKYIDNNIDNKCLSHIDAISDNFLICDTDVKLIDFEYSGMADPHIDIAMFCIYSLYNKQQIDNLIDIYFDNKCPNRIRIKIYCYIAACGLLWSNWCEYKSMFGFNFGNYALEQYKYAKEYSKLAKEMIGDTYE